MKLSKYNAYRTLKNKDILIYNTLSGGLFILPKEHAQLINNLEKEKNKKREIEYIAKLTAEKYIIDDEIDELEIIKYQYLLSQYDKDNLNLTICPTMACNMKCIYCYQDKKPKIMNDDIRRKILTYVKSNIKRIKELNISWFGGEPLLAFDTISYLSKSFIKLCEKYNVKYNAYIISNGYLLNNETIDNFKKLKINGIQITLDGPKEIHDKKRILNNGNGTYDKILENIILLRDKKFNVNIRINIDKNNYKYIYELADELNSKKIKGLSISLGHLQASTEACKSISSSCFTVGEYLLNQHDILKNINKKYPKLFKKSILISEKQSIYCGAVKINSYAIDAEGYMYKCWNDIGNKNKSIYRIDNTEDNIMNLVNYLNFNPFKYQDCNNCVALPICVGGCPYNNLRNEKIKCTRYNDLIEKYLDSVQDNYKI